MSDEYTGLILSDLHGGCSGALSAPVPIVQDLQPLIIPNTVEDKDIPVPRILNKGQQYLYDCFCDLQKRIPPKLDFIVINGEPMQGPAKLSRSMWSNSISSPWGQTQIAYALLKPLRERTDFFWIVLGTPWHDNAFGESLYCLAEKLRCTKNHITNNILGECLILKFGDVIVDIAHSISYHMVYRGSALERERNFSRVDNAIEDGLPDLQIRSHIHTYNVSEDRNGTTITTPGWQLSSPFVRKASHSRGRLNDIGGLLVTIKPEEKLLGRRPYDWEAIRYDHPKLGAIDVPQLIRERSNGETATQLFD